jgi:RNA polymerase sigma-70 factor, ECF subfamily
MPASHAWLTLNKGGSIMRTITHHITEPAYCDISDEQLVRRIADGDKQALQLLFVRHRTAIYRFISRFLDSDSADELTSEVFLDVWRNADRFQGKSKAATWLFAIARYKALSEIRRRSKLQLDEQADAAIEDPGESPATAMDKQDRSELICRCMAKLTPQHREVIDIVYYQGKKIGEAAQLLHVPLNTIKSRMFYARTHMADLLAEAGVDRTWGAI